MRKLIVFFTFLLLNFAVYCPVFALEPTTLVNVVDGDSINVDINNNKEEIRLIGIDAYESYKNNRSYKQAYLSKQNIETIVLMGKKGKQFVKTLIKPGDKLNIEYDVQIRDKYNRLLAYVYLPNGKMLNEIIIRSGYAEPLTISPDTKYTDKFLSDYKYAKQNKLGLWSE